MKPKQKQMLIGAALLAVGLLILRKPTGAKAEQAATQRDLQKAGKPTYTDTQYQLAANRLEQAMFDVGTDEAAIFAIFQALKNNADFLKLNQAFGSRTYSGGFLPAFLNSKLTLVQWLQEELSTSDLNKLNQILRQAGITYTL